MRATTTASSSLAAPVTRTVIRLVTPSASACIRAARSRQTCVSAAVNAAGSASTPDAPDESSSTVSLVDIEPSMSRRSKLSRTASCSAASSAGCSSTASVVITESMVAIEGAIIPAPLVVPPTVQPAGSVTASCLDTVSVVMIAVAAAEPASGVSASSPAALSTPDRTLSRGSCSPISPVEQTATSTAPQPSAAATRSAVACAVWKPSGPVHALAPPEFSTTARSRPLVRTCSVQRIGAALTLLRVRTPAASKRGPSLTTRARSVLPGLALIPAATPAARKPRAAVTPCAVCSLTGRSRQSEGPRSPAGRAPGSCIGSRRRRCPWSGCRSRRPSPAGSRPGRP